MERTLAIPGTTPVLIIAPHGAKCDDANTAMLAELIAKKAGAYAVINQMWERSDKVDIDNDKANCNFVPHINEPVVKEEFLEPIVKYVTKIEELYEFCYIFIIHGVSNNVRNIAKSNVDIILGWGGKNSRSCSEKFKSSFAHFLNSVGFNVFEGNPNGLYSGKTSNNLNQFFKIWTPKSSVESIQLEIAYDLRETLGDCQVTADYIAECIDEIIYLDDTQQYDIVLPMV